MGFTVYYQSTGPVSEKLREAIEEATDALSDGRTWLSCEPVGFFRSSQYLEGGVKPNFDPHPEDAAAAAEEGLPDGTLSDAIEVLCELSRRFDVDWQFGHDHDPGPIGFIRGGVADDELLGQIAAFDEAGDLLDRMTGAARTAGTDDDAPRGGDASSGEDPGDDSDDGPHILRFPSPDA